MLIRILVWKELGIDSNVKPEDVEGKTVWLGPGALDNKRLIVLTGDLDSTDMSHENYICYASRYITKLEKHGNTVTIETAGSGVIIFEELDR